MSQKNKYLSPPLKHLKSDNYQSKQYNYYQGSKCGSMNTVSTGSNSGKLSSGIQLCQDFLDSLNKAKQMVQHREKLFFQPPQFIGHESIQSVQRCESEYYQTSSKTQYLSQESEKFVKVNSVAIELIPFNSYKRRVSPNQQKSDMMELKSVSFFDAESQSISIKSKQQKQEWWNCIDIEQKFKKISSSSIKFYDSITLTGGEQSESLGSEQFKSVVVSPEPVQILRPNIKLQNFHISILMLLAMIIFSQITCLVVNQY